MATIKPPLLCVPLTQSTPEEMVSVLQSPAGEFDLAEVRVDYLKEPRLEPLIACRTHPLLFTNRAARDRGGWRGSEEERLQVLNHALALGAEWLDIERECLHLLQRSETCKTVVSYHNFEETPENLLEIAQEIEAMESDVVKVATSARSHRDNARMAEVLRAIRKPVIGVTMGPLGHVVRILGPKLGAFLVFASLETGKESAPGQVPAKGLLRDYRFRQMTPETLVYGLVDHPSGEHWSRVVNHAFTQTGGNAVAIPLQTDDLQDVLDAYRDLPFTGFSLGPKHWERAKDLVDGLEPGTATVDTITLRDGQWIGQTSSTGPGAEETAGRLAVQSEMWTGRGVTRKTLESLSQDLEKSGSGHEPVPQ